MNRIQTLFAAAKASGKKIFTAYLTMGFPDRNTVNAPWKR